MKLLAIIGILILLVLFFVALSWLTKTLWSDMRRNMRKSDGYKVVEKKVRGGYAVGIEAPDGNWQIFGMPVSNSLEAVTFEDELTERRIGAQDRCDTLNRKLNP